MITANDVVRVGDPDARRRLISIQETPGTAHIDNQVVLDQVLGLSGVFDENCVAHRVIGNIVLDTQVVDSMNGHSSIERVMNSVVSDVTRMHCTDHMEVNRVGAEDEGLAYHVQFDIFNTSGGCLIARRVHDDHSTVLVVL